MLIAMAPQFVDIIPEIKSWLDEKHKMIESFWIGADWRGWARFEIYMAIEKAFGSAHLITHSNDDFWADSSLMIDVLIESSDDGKGSVGIVLRCENVNENEGSFERFAQQFDEDWSKYATRDDIQSDFKGTRLILLGFSGEAVGDGIDTFKVEPKPEHFNVREVNVWARIQDPSE